MSDSLPQPAPDNAEKPNDIPAESMPEPMPEPSSDEKTTTTAEAPIEVPVEETPEVPEDPAAIAADRAGFKFLAIGFAIFFVIIAVCASVVALVMKSMGI